MPCMYSYTWSTLLGMFLSFSSFWNFWVNFASLCYK
jgi:hypothetical protein